MDTNNIMILAIIVTSLATFSSRFLGVLTSEKIKWFIDEDKRIFNNEIHYFDHPYFGVVVAIKEIYNGPTSQIMAY